MYIRDKRSPVPRSTAVSRVMSSNSAKDTGPELALRKALQSIRISNYRLHGKNIVGKPDIYFSKLKLAVFVHGCFWHHCAKCDLLLPKHNRAFWKVKFVRNQERDKRKIQELKKAGWSSVVVWEHDLKKDPEKVALKIKRKLEALS